MKNLYFILKTCSCLVRFLLYENLQYILCMMVLQRAVASFTNLLESSSPLVIPTSTPIWLTVCGRSMPPLDGRSD